MIDQLVALIIDESWWLTLSMSLAVLAVGILLYRRRRSGDPVRWRVLASMNLFFGTMIGTMAFGHLLAVSAKLALGSLGGSIAAFYAVGVALAVPSWWLTYQSLVNTGEHGRRTLALNAWLAVTLLALGLHNLPLAAPAFFNIGYQLNSRRVTGWAILSVAIAVNAALFVGSLIFLASGQGFEQFEGIDR
jgi:hypothetical protein